MTPDEFLNWKNARAQMQATRLPATMAAKPLPYDTQMEVARGQSWIVKTPSSGIPPRTSYTPGRAICESFIVDENPTPPSLLEETNQDADTLEQYVYNLSTKQVAGGEWFIATQVGNVLVVAAGGGDGAKRVQFRSTSKMSNGQITGQIILSEGEGAPQVGALQVFADPFNLFFSGEVDAIGWGYYRPPNEHCDLQEGRWEVEELSLPLDECVGIVPECLKKEDETAIVEITIDDLSSMWSQYHNVDLPPEFSTSATTTIQALNTFNLDTCATKQVRIRRIPEMIPSDPDNCAVPFSETSQATNWHIVQVEEQIARWLKVRWTGEVWEPFGGSSGASQAWDGCDPFTTGCDTPDILDECGMPDCIPDNTCGIAHYKPEDHVYIVTSTESALMGSPTTRFVPVEIADAGALYPCAIEVTLQEVCLFEADSDPVVTQVTPTYLEIDVVTDAVTQGSNIFLNRSTITTCSITPADYDVIDICPLLCYCDQFYECCGAQCGCEDQECVWDWDDNTGYWINTVPCPEGCDCTDEPPPGTPAPGEPRTYTYPCEDSPTVCCDNVSANTAVTLIDFQWTNPCNFDTTQGTLTPNSSSFSATGPCGATLTFSVDWVNQSCGTTQTTVATAVLKQNNTCCYWEISLNQPTAVCQFDPGCDLGAGWPGSLIKVPTCDGETSLDCSTYPPGDDCLAGCDEGGFDFPTFVVTNIGDCN